MKKIVKAFTILSLSVVTFLNVTNAQAQDNDLICAAVMPCDDAGNVTPPFNAGACATYYQTQCRDQFVNNALEKLTQINVENEKLRKENVKLRIKLSNLKRNK